MSPDTVFAIGSVSKSFTAAAVVKLVADGAGWPSTIPPVRSFLGCAARPRTRPSISS